MKAAKAAMRTALKEWSVVTEALARGEQLFLLRKGGISEGKEGFELKHREFLFFPTWEHQHTDLIRPEYHRLLGKLRPPPNNALVLRYCGEVSDIVRAPRSPEPICRLGDHVWSGAYLRKRYEYRPDLPLYVVVVRVHRLPRAVSLPLDRRYAGCRSWVDLTEDVRVRGARPVLSESRFYAARETLFQGLSTPEES